MYKTIQNTDIQIMRQWFDRAQIDYIQQYMALYASFNAWYRMATQTTNDREAINQLRERCQPFAERFDKKFIEEIIPCMRNLVELTQREPLSYASPHWRGEVSHINDWASLLEYWYRVRCLVMHGAEIRTVYVYLAYQTLVIFMKAVIQENSVVVLSEDCLQHL